MSVRAEIEPEPLPHPIDVKYAACSTKVHEFPAMLTCVETAHKEWDTELNKVYTNLEKKLSAKGRQVLANTHKAWLLHRDAEFSLYTEIKDNDQGAKEAEEADNFLFAKKKMGFVSSRAKELQAFDDYTWP